MPYKPVINHPQASPFGIEEPQKKDYYKTHVPVSRIKSIEPDYEDTETKFDKEDYDLLTKYKIRHEFTAIPHLAPPSQIKISADSISLKTLDLSSSLNKIAPFAISDSMLEKLTYAGMHEQRTSLNRSANLTQEEIHKQMTNRHELHKIKDALMEKLEARKATSSKLGWVQLAFTGVALTASLLLAAVTLFVGVGGALSAAMSAIPSVAGGIGGGMGAINSAYSLRTREQKGVVEGLQAELDLLMQKLESLVAFSDEMLRKIQTHLSEVSTSVRHWNIKIWE